MGIIKNDNLISNKKNKFPESLIFYLLSFVFSLITLILMSQPLFGENDIVNINSFQLAFSNLNNRQFYSPSIVIVIFILAFSTLNIISSFFKNNNDEQKKNVSRKLIILETIFSYVLLLIFAGASIYFAYIYLRIRNIIFGSGNEVSIISILIGAFMFLALSFYAIGDFLVEFNYIKSQKKKNQQIEVDIEEKKKEEEEIEVKLKEEEVELEKKILDVLKKEEIKIEKKEEVENEPLKINQLLKKKKKKRRL